LHRCCRMGLVTRNPEDFDDIPGLDGAPIGLPG
jgi:predicted nucleic acid-binding protein